MEPVSISLISYLNTRPFVYGLIKSPLWTKHKCTFDVPAQSAARVIQGTADVGIIPIATLPLVPNGRIVGNYCIGADEEVYTVALFSNHPIEEAVCVHMDTHSRTSVALTKVLANSIFKRTPLYVDGIPHFQEGTTYDDCYLLIGDKVFEYEHLFRYKLDLALAWKKATGMPFVFAAWIGNKELPSAFMHDFDRALSYGVQHIPEVSQHIQAEYPGIPVQKYLSHYIQFDLTAEKRKAIEYFLRLITS